MEISGPRMQFEHPLAATARPLLQRISKALSGAVEGIYRGPSWRTKA